jgi:hypothetical protein
MSKSSSVNIPSNYDIQLGGDGSTIKSDTGLDLAITQPIVTQSTSTSDSTASLDLKIEPLDVKIEPLDVKIEPLDVKIEPLKVDTDSKIDVKPLAVDTCTTIKLAPLPPTRVEQPYCTHFGFTYMGMELFGFTMSGKSGMFLSSPPKPQYHSIEMAEPHRPLCDEPRSTEPPGHHKSGLRVRINEK